MTARGCRLLRLSVFLPALAIAGLLPGLARAAAPAPVFGREAMVVTSQPDATRAGEAILRAGGNAVDAAVATAFALAVTQPQSTGIGGGAFLLIHLADGSTLAIDARETAPAEADRDLYVRQGVPEDASLFGGLAVGTPGLVAGLALALERHGTLPLSAVLQPAIRLAEGGYEINSYQAALMEHVRRRGLPERFPATAAIQLPPADEMPLPGWRQMQKELAGTLQTLADEGPDVFYTGRIARKIVGEVRRRGGILSLDDLAAYRPTLREPVRGSYRGFEVRSFPPPSSGGVAIVQTLNILEGFDLGSLGAGSSASIHRIAEAMKLAFADRAGWLGDPDFVPVPVAALVSKEYAVTLRRRINPPRWRRAPWSWRRSEVAIRVKGPGTPPRDAGTTHLSVIDAAGNAVALTETINTPWGSWVTVPGTGILLNNEMDDFAKRPGEPNVYGLIDTRGTNAIAPRKRPLSSMSPTIVLQEGKPFLVTGSPGGPRIISSTLLAIVNTIDFGMDISAAVSAPRFHHQWMPDTLFVEEGIPADVVQALGRRGHQVVEKGTWSAVESIWVDPKTGHRYGAADPRRGGLALGY